MISTGVDAILHQVGTIQNGGKSARRVGGKIRSAPRVHHDGERCRKNGGPARSLRDLVPPYGVGRGLK